MKRNRRLRPPVQAPSAFAGFRFPPEVILLAVRWYLRNVVPHINYVAAVVTDADTSALDIPLEAFDY